ncbi:MAG: hypothetical protein WCF42_20455, partial [Terriglobales bacterium]
MTDTLDDQIDELIRVVSDPIQGASKMFATTKAWERSEVELALCRSLRRLASTPPTAASPTEPPTAETILTAMGEIMRDLQSGRMTAADAKARLYAYQIALSAMRTIDTTQARRQKEERLRKTQRTAQTNSRPPSTIAATASPRREARRRNRQKTSRKTTARVVTGLRPV